MIEAPIGTGNPITHLDRAGPVTLIAAGGEHYLVECGTWPVLRTHLHGDHITDLNDVITRRWIMTFELTRSRMIHYSSMRLSRSS